MTAVGISLRDLTIAYDKHPAVHHLDGRFSPGSMTALVGPNGAGKSTLLKAIIGVLKPASGSIDCAGIHGRDLGYLPQMAELDRAFPLTVADTVLLGAWRRMGALRGVDAATARQARAALAAVGLEGFERRRIGAAGRRGGAGAGRQDRGGCRRGEGWLERVWRSAGYGLAGRRTRYWF